MVGFVIGALLWLTCFREKAWYESITHIGDIKSLRRSVYYHDEMVASGGWPRSLTPREYAPHVVIVTAASASYVPRVLNLIGSIHYHEPGIKVVIYDLGLEESDIAELWPIPNVDVVMFDFEQYPTHVRDLSNYAWKSLIITDANAKYGHILYLDSGEELWKPIDEVVGLMRAHGHFFTVQDTTICDYTAPQSFRRLKISENETIQICSERQVSSGILGVNGQTSRRLEKVLKHWRECSLSVNCIAPPGSNLSNHKFDQSILSLLIYSDNLRGEDSDRIRVFGDDKYWADWGTIQILSPDLLEDIIFFSRRYHCPRPYTNFVKSRVHLSAGMESRLKHYISSIGFDYRIPNERPPSSTSCGEIKYVLYFMITILITETITLLCLHFVCSPRLATRRSISARD